MAYEQKNKTHYRHYIDAKLFGNNMQQQVDIHIIHGYKSRLWYEIRNFKLNYFQIMIVIVMIML